MTPADEALLPLVDRIYESVERPELWPDTIGALGAVIGGRRDFWDAGHAPRLPNANAREALMRAATEPFSFRRGICRLSMSMHKNSAT